MLLDAVYGLGHSPNSQLLEGQVELDNSGYVIVEADSTRTSVEGVFAGCWRWTGNPVKALLVCPP